MSDAAAIADTETTMIRRMMPQDANPAGNVFGGSIMKYVDEIAGIVAQRHARTNVVTARLDEMNFLEPVLVGDLLILRAWLVFCGRSSMELRVHIEAEDPDTGERVETGNCFVTMVALNERGSPTRVRPVEPHGDEEQGWHEDAKARYEARRKR